MLTNTNTVIIIHKHTLDLNKKEGRLAAFSSKISCYVSLLLQTQSCAGTKKNFTTDSSSAVATTAFQDSTHTVST